MGIFNFFGLGSKEEEKKKAPQDDFEGMQTTVIGEDSNVLGAEYRYNIPVLRDYISMHPNSAFAHYMLAELLLDQGNTKEAKKEFITGLKLENHHSDHHLDQDEVKLKKKAKSKLEKALGQKL